MKNLFFLLMHALFMLFLKSVALESPVSATASAFLWDLSFKEAIQSTPKNGNGLTFKH